MSPYEKLTHQTSASTVTQPTGSQAHPDSLLKTNAQRELTLAPTQSTADQKDGASKSSLLSPFYSHRTSRTSLEVMKTETKITLDVNEIDLESGLDQSRSSIMMKPDPNCPVWPGHKAQKEAVKAARRKNAKGFKFMKRYSKKTRRTIQTLIALAVIGCIIGIGLGVNKAVGGGIWHKKRASTHA